VPNAPRIELPRPAIIAALGALILAVTFAVTHGGETGTSPVTSSGNSSTTTTTGTSTTGTDTGTATTTTETTAKPAQPAVEPGQGLPAGVARALDAQRVVVLFFYEPAGADDQATRAAVRAVRSAGSRVRLFSDTVAHISNYRRVVGTLGISQTPAMVVIDKNRNARLFEGFLDAGTIRQSVRDAL
jgi:hypothetical protein